MMNTTLSWAEIKLDAIKSNINSIKQKVGNRKIIAVVKANAYGHGVVDVARAIEEQVDYLAVATVNEAVELREAEIKLPILNLFCVFPEHAEEILEYDITQMVCQYDVAEALSEQAKKMRKTAKVHVKVDTGMTRIGVHYSHSLEFIKKIANLPNLEIEGVYTHFASADEVDKNYTYLQLKRFKAIISGLTETGIKVPIKHAANSATVLDIPSAYFDAVRPGLILYGIYPSLHVSHDIALKPVLSLKTRITYLKTVSAGVPVGYGLTYTVPKKTIIATLPVGYADGFRRELSNHGEVLIRGKRVPIVGRVCMDEIMCDVGEITDVEVGDEVVLVGKQGKEQISVDDVAEKCGTISYEILCGIGRRVKRVYI